MGEPNQFPVRSADSGSAPRKLPVASLFLFLFVGFLLSLATAWILPDVGRHSFVGFPTSVRLPQPGDVRAMRDRTLTSTRLIYSWAYDGGTQPPPAVPADPRAFLDVVESLDFQRAKNTFVSPADTWVPPSFAAWSAELRGFPCRCLWSWRTDGTFQNAGTVSRTSALELPGFATGPGVIGYSLPITPLWTGLAVNTAFWAAVAACVPWVIRRTYAKIRQRIEQSRIDRGLCPSCLYPIEPEAARCPECGRVPSVGMVRRS